MGNICCRQKSFSMPPVENRMEYKYGEDTNYAEIEHRDRIKCSSGQISLLQNLQSCEQKLRHSRKLFKDDTMPLESVYIVDSQNPQSKNLCLLERPFQIIDDVSNQKYQVYNPKYPPKISDIVYNRSGLQNFGVFLSFLADHPSLIEDIILTSQNSYGIYAISMIVDGQKQAIYIDDRIICKKKKPLFVQPVSGKYIWPILIEKAWLKIKGIQINSINKLSYMSVFNSFLNLPIRHFNLIEETPSNKDEHQSIRIKNEELLLNNLQNLKHYHGCIVTTRKQPLHKLGIPKQTNFYLIKCFQYKKQTLFLLRNTNQSMGQFRGEYRMSIISEDLMDQVFKYSNSQVTVEGNFILTKSEFLEQIDYFSIIYYQQQAHQIAEKVITLKTQQDYFTSFTLHGDGLVNICLKQVIVGDPEPKYCPISYNIIRLQSDAVISKETNNQSSNGAEMNYLLDGIFLNLEAGKYLIRLKKKTPQVFGKGKSVEKLLIFAKHKATFDSQDQIQLSNYFKALLPRLGQKQLLQKKILEEICFKHQCETVHYWLGDIVVVFVEKNNVSKECKKLELDFSEMKNLRSVSHPTVRAQQTSIDFQEDSLTIVFEKICLSEKTTLGNYIVQPF